VNHAIPSLRYARAWGHLLAAAEALRDVDDDLRCGALALARTARRELVSDSSGDADCASAAGVFLNPSEEKW
jgi:hypothetical protein